MTWFTALSLPHLLLFNLWLDVPTALICFSSLPIAQTHGIMILRGDMRISDLKEFADKTVTLRMTDGEVAKVFVRFADEEYEDIIVDVLESTRFQPYNPASAYTFAATDIISAEVSS
jgi:hypothetical protein